MKKLLLLLLIVPSLLFAQENGVTRPQMWNVIDSSEAYINAVKADGGIVNSNQIVQSYMMMAEDNGMSESIEFGFIGEGGIKEDGTVEQIYDFSGNFNNAEQATPESRPYLSGNIAPDERQGMKNPNGDSRYITHPEISFAADEPWTVTTCLNWEGANSNLYNFICGIGNTSTTIGLTRGVGTETYYIYGSDFSKRFNLGTTTSLIGKNNVITITYDGTILKIYENGIYRYTKTITDAFIFDKFFYLSAYSAYGTISAHIIRSEALSPAQVAAEAELLQSLYPPIPSVEIDNYTVSISNFDAVASSNGTVITEAADNTDWATGAARWRYHSDDSAIGSWAGKLFNKAARDVIIANPPDGWHVSTEAELTAIATYGGNSLKKDGTDYWTTTGGINYKGFSALGSSSLNADGTSNTIKNTFGCWCADSDKVLMLNHDDNTATITTVTANEGFSIRLVKDE